MPTAYRPVFQTQLPDCRCRIGGKCLGGLSCSAYGMAMQIDRSTLGARRPTGCAVRAGTGDTTGGLTLRQVADVASDDYGVRILRFVSTDATKPRVVADALRAGRSVTAQIGTRPLLGTSFRSTAGAINHLVLVNEGRDWGEDGYPEEVLVFDPAADGRDRDYHVDQGPSWWPWDLFLRACAALQPWGEDDPRTTGPGRIWCGIGPDTEPHVILRYGGVKTKPFPDRMRAIDPPGKRKTVSVRSRPDRNLAKDIIRPLDPGDLFVAYQRTTGVEKSGSKVWYGNQRGTQWVPSGEMSHQGGTT